jgi:hypothetical protein
MEANQLKTLLTEVKETVATGIVPVKRAKNTNSFGIVDLWNIQRNAKTASLGRRSSL